jgi:[ribosomal protein S5]-alanine N-acetyltransferase
MAKHIETQRLILRPLATSDAVHFARLLGPDPEAVRQMAQMPDPCTEDAAREWIEARLGPGGYVFAILRRSDDEFLGIAGFGGPADMPEVGYWIGAGYRGLGYATEAILALVEYAASIGVPRLHADTFPNNPGSERVLAKVGFAVSGTVERNFPARGGRRGLTRHVYDITRR